jgi:hypothetical protein
MKMSHRNALSCIAIVVCLLLFGVVQADAAVVADRAALDALLGGAAVTEGFESFTICYGCAVNLDVAVLNSNSIANGQGPGLVVPGVNFVTSQQVQLNGPGYYGQPSNNILSNSNSSWLMIDFTVLTSAFGMDLLTFAGYPDVATVTVFATDDITPLATISGISIPTSSPVFFGYEDAAGIGKVVLTGTFGWSPLIDNVTFGPTSVPEPATSLLLGAGLFGAALVRSKMKRRP